MEVNVQISELPKSWNQAFKHFEWKSQKKNWIWRNPVRRFKSEAGWRFLDAPPPRESSMPAAKPPVPQPASCYPGYTPPAGLFIISIPLKHQQIGQYHQQNTQFLLYLPTLPYRSSLNASIFSAYLETNTVESKIHKLQWRKRLTPHKQTQV